MIYQKPNTDFSFKDSLGPGLRRSGTSEKVFSTCTNRNRREINTNNEEELVPDWKNIGSVAEKNHC